VWAGIKMHGHSVDVNFLAELVQSRAKNISTGAKTMFLRLNTIFNESRFYPNKRDKMLSLHVHSYMCR